MSLPASRSISPYPLSFHELMQKRDESRSRSGAVFAKKKKATKKWEQKKKRTNTYSSYRTHMALFFCEEVFLFLPFRRGGGSLGRLPYPPPRGSRVRYAARAYPRRRRRARTSSENKIKKGEQKMLVHIRRSTRGHTCTLQCSDTSCIVSIYATIYVVVWYELHR